jgi:hypothetical protein
MPAIAGIDFRDAVSLENGSVTLPRLIAGSQQN